MRCKSCESKESEITFLRELVKDLQDRVMSFSTTATSNLDAMKNNKVEDPTYIHPILGTMEKMTAVTEDEKKEKEAAIGEVMQILGQG